MAKARDLVGLRFGLLTVLQEADPLWRSNGYRIRRHLCQCDCGGTAVVTQSNLVSGGTRSCGCRAGRLRHGHRRAHQSSPTHTTWCAMRARCQNPGHSAYPRYGGAGITVCPRWADPDTGFQAFLADMGERPEGHTLDRIDASLGYFKENCRWATSRQQYENKRVTRGPDGRFSKTQPPTERK